MYSPKTYHRVAFLLVAITLITVGHVFADSAQWKMNPTNDWNTVDNWNPHTVPNGPADIATFDSSQTADVSISADVEVNAILFGTRGNAYSIRSTPAHTLTLSGSGIVNGSGLIQNLSAAPDDGSSSASPGFGTIVFKNTASAGTQTTITDLGSNIPGKNGGTTTFLDSSTAGIANLVVGGAQVAQAHGGLLEFYSDSTAGNAMITVSAGLDPDVFGEQAHLSFHNNASAGKSTILVQGGNNPDDQGAGFGLAEFWDSTTAGTAAVTIGGASGNQIANGGFLFFYNQSAAGNGQFTVDGAQVGGLYGGNLVFLGHSNAGSATLTCNGGTVAYYDSNGYHLNFGANIGFAVAANAANATIVVNSGSVAGGRQGILNFGGSASAGNATIINNGSGLVGPVDWSFQGGRTEFFAASTAGNATITASGATARGAPAGLIDFAYNSNAANATITVEAGSYGGAGGYVAFVGASSGGTSNVTVRGNGTLDINSHYPGTNASPAVSIGSLEGDGDVFLGSNKLGVGTNDASTSFHGTIHDGTRWSSSGSGSFDKVGRGTLTLTGANTYSGGTAIDQGVLQIANTAGSAAGSGPVLVNPGGTLSGDGSIDGSVTVEVGGTISSQGNVGALTIKGALTLNDESNCTFLLNNGTGTTHKVVANGVTISKAAFIDLFENGTGQLPIGTVITLIENTSLLPINGTFSDLPDNSTYNTSWNKYLVSYHGGDGNDLTLTVIPRIGLVGL